MKQQKGFSIVMATFILVVLSLLGGYMVKLSGVQNATASKAVQAARAYHAAKAGIEWSIAKIMHPSSDCLGVTAVSSLAGLTELNGFTITFSFVYAPIDFSEGVSNFTVYKVRSKSEFGSYSSADYISRTVEMSMVCKKP